MHKNNYPLNYLSLFCGCGGLDYGFRSKEFRCLGAYDIDSSAIETYKKNYNHPTFIQDLSQGNLLNQKAVKNKVDVVISGSPCQGFSTLGKRLVNDPRNKLLLRAITIANDVNASFFVAENVMGALSGSHKLWWDQANDLLKSYGYLTNTVIINAHDHGVAQIRKRAFLFGIKSKDENFFTKNAFTSPLKHKVLKDVLANITSPIKNLCVTDNKIALRIKPGQKLSDVRGGVSSIHSWDIPEVFGIVDKKDKAILECLMKARRAKANRVRDFGDGDYVSTDTLSKILKFGVKRRVKKLAEKGFVRVNEVGNVNLAYTFNGKYRRLAWDRPSPTVDTNFCNPRYFLHPTHNRGFTTKEASLIQGFPKSFKFGGSEAIKARHIGNAVPPPVSKSLANYIKSLEC